MILSHVSVILNLFLTSNAFCRPTDGYLKLASLRRLSLEMADLLRKLICFSNLTKIIKYFFLEQTPKNKTIHFSVRELKPCLLRFHGDCHTPLRSAELLSQLLDNFPFSINNEDEIHFPKKISHAI